MLRIVQVEAADEIAHIRQLFQDYAASLDFGLEFQGFAAELADLPGRYAPPAGRLLLAWYQGEPAGCGALRPLEAGVCEMKRLYVAPRWRRARLGRALAEALIAEARQIGYTAMRLDTVPTMTQALALYTALGFREIAPYYASPLTHTRFMQLDLTAPRLSGGENLSQAQSHRGLS